MTDSPVATSGERIVATAPGKLMLLGEYAVLDGATAIVAAVDRRAIVTLTRTDNSHSALVADELGWEARVTAGAAPLRWDPPDASTGHGHLAATVLTDAASRAALPAFDGTLTTADFFDADRPSAKFGLGSSAALTVAFAGALRRLAGDATPVLADLVALHRAAQGGRGSGFDVAASLLGGIVGYRLLGPDTPEAKQLQLPDDLHWCCVWSGRSTSTSGFLRRLADWRTSDPRHEADYRARIATLSAIADQGSATLANGTAPRARRLIEAMAAYADEIVGLGAAAGLPIVGDEHRHIAEPAATCGVLYKTSGAGGGDVGIAVTDDPDRLDAFRRALPARFRTIDVAVDPQGLTVTG